MKALTLGSWKSPDGFENPPLTVAIRDGDGFSPFSLAALHGNYSLARAIAEICLAQYQPTEDTPGRRKRWTIYEESSYEDSDLDDSDSDAGSGGLNIYSTIVDENFTVENVTEISSVVKSHIDLSTMISWPCMASWLNETHSENSVVSQAGLIMHSVQADNLPLLRFMLEIWGTQQIHGIIGPFNTAVQLGRTAILSEMIKATGAGIPLDELVKQSGVVIVEKPRYYQGLSIAGKKNLQWAKRGHDQYSHNNHQSAEQPPVLKAAHSGSIDSLQWLLSDVALQKYMEFAATNKGDRKVRMLEQSQDGFENTIKKWLVSRRKSFIRLYISCSMFFNQTCT